MNNSRDVLTQEEISALLETVPESAPDAAKEEREPSVKKEPYKQYWKSGSSNIISSEEFDSLGGAEGKKGLLEHSEDDRYIKSTRVKLKYRLKQTIPFLELLLEFGNGGLKQGDSIEVSTRGGSVVSGLFEGFFYERDSFEGGILLKSDGEEETVEAGKIAIDTDGGFVISSAPPAN